MERCRAGSPFFFVFASINSLLAKAWLPLQRALWLLITAGFKWPTIRRPSIASDENPSFSANPANGKPLRIRASDCVRGETTVQLTGGRLMNYRERILLHLYGAPKFNDRSQINLMTFLHGRLMPVRILRHGIYSREWLTWYLIWSRNVKFVLILITHEVPVRSRSQVPFECRLSWCSNSSSKWETDRERAKEEERGIRLCALCQKSSLPRHGGGCIVVTMSLETIVSGSPISHRDHAVPRTGPVSKENVRAVLLSYCENVRRDLLARSLAAWDPRRLERTRCGVRAN